MGEDQLFNKFGREIPRGTVLFREGDSGKEMYVVQSGQVAISKRVRDVEKVLAHLGPGEFFGEMAIISNTARTATATVASDARLLVIDPKTFEAMVRGNAEIAVRMIKKLAALPFDAQPGEKFVYGYNTDILGYVVEIVSGLSLDEFFAKRITGPLKMKDTHFFLPESKLGRLASVYGLDEKGVLTKVEDARGSVYVKGPRRCFSGGAGLLSTAGDYARFLQMLLNGGELDGARLLSPKTVALMTVDHLDGLYGPEGFGLGFWVTEKLGRDGRPGTVGSYGWGGAYHTTYWVDPREQMVCVLMTQLLPADGSDLHGKFRSLVYQAVIESGDQ